MFSMTEDIDVVLQNAVYMLYMACVSFVACFLGTFQGHNDAFEVHL